MTPPSSPTTSPSLAITPPVKPTPIVYPDSDGKPMSDNTLQYQWIVLFKENLEVQFGSDPQVFIAGDLLWYPVEGHPEIAKAPDVLVVFGRPKGYRGSYQQWREDDIAPQVVFEILSPNNTRAEMSRKLLFYHQYGVEEYYIYDPQKNDLRGWIRRDGILDELDSLQNWQSPRLGIRFDPAENPLKVYGADDTPFLSTLEREQLRQGERQRAEQERQRAEQERQRADRLAAKLRELGLDPKIL
ncbi:Uma2 family endonuclease [Prochlorothrix hollandica]|uniref:Putative restriction endonuclease domain-containing protein n=1 Tax=Prochlorothrix hollandica PCC 9006 = CALU 1027 TaxID=317619 RepID=A0A0M2PQS3_PROHO|nr:Uma2 family endonuclease [Prochlorothrix hollandica]KKI98574.1 hypothetical protein PROH_16910 [Prochlorothrix hollandica PCC 9006 = CALU 1027]